MPTLPNASTTLSGDLTGITKTALIQRVLHRVKDEPWKDFLTGAVNASATSFPVASSTPYQPGMVVDYVEDGSLESCLITGVPDTTHITVSRAHLGSTAASHLSGAAFRVMGRNTPQTLSEIIDDYLLTLWPDLFEVKEVNWTINPAGTPELWYGLPADCERELALWQQTNSTPLDLREVPAWAGNYWMTTAFIGGAVSKALQAYGVTNNSADGLLHLTYLSRLSLSTLTPAQQSVLVYLSSAAILDSDISGESKPDRRPNMGTIADAAASRGLLLQSAELLKEREKERLWSYLPRRNRMVYRGGRHYADSFYTTWHSVRPF